MLFLFLSFLYIFFSFSYTLIIEAAEQSSNVSLDQYEFTNRNAKWKSNYVQITNTKFLLPYNITPCTHDADYYCDLFVLRG